MKTAPTKPFTVLYADDDMDDRMIMNEVLALLGVQHQVVEVPNGEAVLAYLSSLHRLEQHPCLIVLDNNMPLVSGREALMRIRQEPAYNHIPVAVLSTTISQQDFYFFQNLGARCYTKPSTVASFKQVVTEMLQYCCEEKTAAA
ncbi:response regulator [Pseudocnuella soli]|uniref:response regulator n=1 Tax=Pseudocnuella soli TaxID=2502779 RepID=UPI00104500AE|nr:response regulator [Pseudocnuella soli]